MESEYRIPRRRNRRRPREEGWEPACGVNDPSLPYGGKVMVARRKKPEPPWFIAFQVILTLFVLFMCYYSYYYFDNVVFQIHKTYAHFGHAEAQHKVGQRYLQGVGTKADHKKAVHWFKQAADKGHPEASYNLAVAHLKGHTKLKKGSVKKLIQHANDSGVEEAHHIIKNVCPKMGC